MTEVYFCKSDDHRILRISGHAGYGERGKDIVCAGISALAQAYLFYMEDLEDAGKATIDSVTETDGFMVIYSQNPSIESQAAFDLTRQGIEAISETYPDYVKIF